MLKKDFWEYIKNRNLFDALSQYIPSVLNFPKTPISDFIDAVESSEEFKRIIEDNKELDKLYKQLDDLESEEDISFKEQASKEVIQDFFTNTLFPQPKLYSEISEIENSTFNNIISQKIVKAKETQLKFDYPKTQPDPYAPAINVINFEDQHVQFGVFCPTNPEKVFRIIMDVMPEVGNETYAKFDFKVEHTDGKIQAPVVDKKKSSKTKRDVMLVAGSELRGAAKSGAYIDIPTSIKGIAVEVKNGTTMSLSLKKATKAGVMRVYVYNSVKDVRKELLAEAKIIVHQDVEIENFNRKIGGYIESSLFNNEENVQEFIEAIKKQDGKWGFQVRENELKTKITQDQVEIRELYAIAGYTKIPFTIKNLHPNTPGKDMAEVVAGGNSYYVMVQGLAKGFVLNSGWVEVGQLRSKNISKNVILKLPMPKANNKDIFNKAFTAEELEGKQHDANTATVGFRVKFEEKMSKIGFVSGHWKIKVDDIEVTYLKIIWARYPEIYILLNTGGPRKLKIFYSNKTTTETEADYEYLGTLNFTAVKSKTVYIGDVLLTKRSAGFILAGFTDILKLNLNFELTLDSMPVEKKFIYGFKVDLREANLNSSLGIFGVKNGELTMDTLPNIVGNYNVIFKGFMDGFKENYLMPTFTIPTVSTLDATIGTFTITNQDLTAGDTVNKTVVIDNIKFKIREGWEKKDITGYYFELANTVSLGQYAGKREVILTNAQTLEHSLEHRYESSFFGIPITKTVDINFFWLQIKENDKDGKIIDLNGKIAIDYTNGIGSNPPKIDGNYYKLENIVGNGTVTLTVTIDMNSFVIKLIRSNYNVPTNYFYLITRKYNTRGKDKAGNANIIGWKYYIKIFTSLEDRWKLRNPYIITDELKKILRDILTIVKSNIKNVWESGIKDNYVYYFTALDRTISNKQEVAEPVNLPTSSTEVTKFGVKPVTGEIKTDGTDKVEVDPKSDPAGEPPETVNEKVNKKTFTFEECLSAKILITKVDANHTKLTITFSANFNNVKIDTDLNIGVEKNRFRELVDVYLQFFEKQNPGFIVEHNMTEGVIEKTYDTTGVNNIIFNSDFITFYFNPQTLKSNSQGIGVTVAESKLKNQEIIIINNLESIDSLMESVKIYVIASVTGDNDELNFTIQLKSKNFRIVQNLCRAGIFYTKESGKEKKVKDMNVNPNYTQDGDEFVTTTMKNGFNWGVKNSPTIIKAAWTINFSFQGAVKDIAEVLIVRERDSVGGTIDTVGILKDKNILTENCTINSDFNKQIKDFV